jgi:hypothetical protein
MQYPVIGSRSHISLACVWIHKIYSHILNNLMISFTEFKYSREKKFILADLLSGSVLVSAAVPGGVGLWRYHHLQGQVSRLSHRRQRDLDQGAAFYVSADPDPDPGARSMQIHADPDPSQTLIKVTKQLN